MSGISPIGNGFAGVAAAARPTIAGPAVVMDPKGSGATGRATSVGSSVQGLLNELGRGLEGNQALKLAITLMILMALLQAAQQDVPQSSSDPSSLLGALGQTSGGAGGVLLIEQTSVSVSNTTIVAAFGQSNAPTQTAGGLVDVQA